MLDAIAVGADGVDDRRVDELLAVFERAPEADDNARIVVRADVVRIDLDLRQGYFSL
jgi:hypothetical protein